MLPELTRRLISDWDTLKTGLTRPSDLDYLGIMGSVEGGTTSFMAFVQDGSMPVFAVKVHRDSKAKERALKENKMLKVIQERFHAAGNSVPKVIFCGEIGNSWVLVQSIVKGSPMSCAMAGDGGLNLIHTKENFVLVANWLKDLYASTQGNEKLIAEDSLESLDKDIRDFSAIFEPGALEREFLKEIALSLPDIVNERTYIRHGDLCRQNILVDISGPRISVIDWTEAKVSYVALNDILFFLSSYYLQVRKKTGLSGFTQAFQNTFLEDNPYQRLVHGVLEDFCRPLSIDPDLIDVYLGLFLVEQALFEYRKMVTFARVGGLPRFTMTLAVEQNRGLEGAVKEQLWCHFFKVLACHHRDRSKGAA